jgi:hypothetical protein
VQECRLCNGDSSGRGASVMVGYEQGIGACAEVGSVGIGVTAGVPKVCIGCSATDDGRRSGAVGLSVAGDIGSYGSGSVFSGACDIGSTGSCTAVAVSNGDGIVACGKACSGSIGVTAGVPEVGIRGSATGSIGGSGACGGVAVGRGYGSGYADGRRLRDGDGGNGGA